MKTKKSKKKRVIFIAIACVVAISLIVGFALRPKAESYTEETVKQQDMATYYRFNGNIEAKDRQIVIAEGAMQMKNININEGDTILKNDVLFEGTQGQKIKAKIDGEVGEILIKEGAMVMSGTKLTNVTNYSDLQVTIKEEVVLIPKEYNRTIPTPSDMMRNQ